MTVLRFSLSRKYIRNQAWGVIGNLDGTTSRQHKQDLATCWMPIPISSSSAGRGAHPCRPQDREQGSTLRSSNQSALPRTRFGKINNLIKAPFSTPRSRQLPGEHASIPPTAQRRPQTVVLRNTSKSAPRESSRKEHSSRAMTCFWKIPTRSIGNRES